MRQSAAFIDLHQDMLSGVSRFDDGFPSYGSSFLTGSSRATAIFSSLYPHSEANSLVEQLAEHAELVEDHSALLRLVTMAEDLSVEDHRTGVLPHSEGFHLPGIDPGSLHELWAEHSLRSLALTWNYETEYGYSCYDDAAAALKPAGRTLLRSLETSPILLDLSHLNEGGFFDALDHYAPPVLVTHSFCRAIGDHPRGLTDDQLRALAQHGGLVGLAFDPDFLGRGSIDEALRHVDRIASLAGENAVSIGSDWGVAAMGELGDPASLAQLLVAVEDRFGSRMAEKFAYANAHEFLTEQLPRCD
jgi:membrane dipeptidase